MRAVKNPIALKDLFHWMYVICLDLAASMAVLLSVPLPMAPKRKKGQPILLIHGYVNHGGVWMMYKRWLEKAKFGPVYTISLGSPFQSIEAYAEKVHAKAQQIAKETGRKDLILIGHSMGGLVSSHYAHTLAPPNSVRKIITLGTPFEGTPMAFLGIGECARQMRPNSPFLRNLRKSMAKSKVPLFCIAALRDPLVIPGKSAARKKGPVLEKIGHASMLYSQRTFQLLKEALN